MVDMASPLSKFLSAQERTLGIKRQQQDLRRQKFAAEQDVNRQRLQGAQLLQQVVDRVKQIPDVSQRMQIMQRVRPELQRFGVELPNFQPNDLTDEGLVPLETGLARANTDLTAFEREFNTLSQAGQLSPEEQRRFARIRAGLEPRSGSITGRERIAGTPGLSQSVSESEKIIETGKERGKGIAKTEQLVINEGLDAAKGIPVLKRSLDLLDGVRTGGLNAAVIRARQLFGVEGADEGELSANLGQAVLGDLRQTFGAAFTEKEGARLERIRANLGRSAAVNRRLISQALQIAEDAAERAIERAIDAGDTSTVEDIQRLLEFNLGDQGANNVDSEINQLRQELGL